MNRDDKNAHFVWQLRQSILDVDVEPPAWHKIRDAVLSGKLEDFDTVRSKLPSWDGTERRGDIRTRAAVSAGRVSVREARSGETLHDTYEQPAVYIDPTGGVHVTPFEWDYDGFYNNGE